MDVEPVILVTRNLQSFKTLPAGQSSIWALHHRFYHLIAKSAALAAAAFQPVLGSGDAAAKLRELFQEIPPPIALVQGDSDPSHIMDKATTSDRSTVSSAMSSSANSSERRGSWTSVRYFSDFGT